MNYTNTVENNVSSYNPNSNNDPLTNKPEKAGFFIRLWALFIDSFLGLLATILIIIIIFVFTVIVLALASILLSPTASDQVKEILTKVFSNVEPYKVTYEVGTGMFYLLNTLYNWLFLRSKWCATIGKRVAGIYVLNEQEKPLSFFQVILREFIGKWFNEIIFCIGYLMVGFRKDKRGLHDLIAGSNVYHGKVEDHFKNPDLV